MKSDLRIVFMGTPEFAVPSLQILYDNGYNIAGVITAPDKPSGRGLQLSASPVKQYALSKGLKVLQPEKLKNPDFAEDLMQLKADIQVVVAFRMLPEIIWNMPPKGTFNLHASLLPQYRGAAPINWAIINGEKKTGLTTFFLQQEIDTGDIILQSEEEIMESDNVGTLYERLRQKGADLVLKTVQLIDSGNVSTKPQVFGENIKPAPKIFKETCRIDWSKKTGAVHNLIRGLSPYPAAFFYLNNKACKVFQSHIFDSPENTSLFLTDNKTYFFVKCADFYLSVTELQLEGKKKMGIEEFLRGTKIESVS